MHSMEYTPLDSSAPPVCAELREGCRLRIIGLGGVGGILLQFLLMYLRSLMTPARVALIDGDTFEVRNAQRMSFDTLGNKAEVKAAEAIELVTGSAVEVVAVPEYVTGENIARLIPSGEGDFVFLCVDNHVTRRLVSEHCQTLSDMTLISGGNDEVALPKRLGTYGNVQVAIRQGGRNVTIPITRFHPEIANAEGALPGGPNCSQMAISAPQILFANLAVSSAMLSAFLACVWGRLSYQEVQFDILAGRCVPHFPVVAESGG
jgi:hypothetical protein